MKFQLRTLKDAQVNGKKVLLRADLNVPYKDGKIQDDTRLHALLPTLKYLIENDAKVIILTHFGRPKGVIDDSLRVDPIAKGLSDLLGKKVEKLDECIGDEVEAFISKMHDGDLVLLENTRFHPEEKNNDDQFSKKLAGLADIYVNDAFGAIHRAHASTVGVCKYLDSYAGLLVQKEVEVLSAVLESPAHPICLVMGGAKIDTKIGILEKFLNFADYFLIGGALANTFLAAEGYEVGTSLCEFDKIDVARDFLLAADAKREYVYLPLDVVVSDEINENADSLDVNLSGVGPDMKILDIGSLTVDTFERCIAEAKTIIWNGPMGLYEFEQFANGTKRLANAIASSDAITLVGGGDSIDAINKFGIPHEKFTHISTGGGAMIEFLEGKILAGLEPLLKQ